jgi:GGDEF domain-containing protein
MQLVSFKSFLKPGKPVAPDFVRFLCMLLQGLSIHVIEGDSEDLAAFREETAPLADQLSENSSTDDILMATTVALRSLEEYNRRTKKFISAQSLELKTALTTMTETISVLAQSRSESVQQLAVIERKMVQASAIEDIRLLRVKLQDCLTTIREENTRLREESEARLGALQQKIESTFTADDSSHPPLIAIDTVTGLGNRAAGEKLIGERIAEGRSSAIALFLVNKLAMVNKRFGRVVGDEILVMVAQHIGQAMPLNSILFRWSGPALVAVVDIPSDFDEVSRKLGRITNSHLEKNIESGARSIFVPIHILLSIQKIGAASLPPEVFKILDQFVSSNVVEELSINIS